MSAATSPSRSNRPAIIAVAILVVASALPGPSAADGQEPKTWTLSDAHGNAIADLAFSPDGKTLASGCDQVVQFWDVPAALRGQASKLDR